MPIKLLPDGTPEERARMAKSAALHDRIEALLVAQRATDGTLIEAIGMLFAGRATTPEAASKFATDISAAIHAVYNLKEKAK